MIRRASGAGNWSEIDLRYARGCEQLDQCAWRLEPRPQLGRSQADSNVQERRARSMATTVRRRERSASCSLRLAARPLPVITAPFLRRAVAGRVEEARGVRTAARPSVSSFERMTARRWRLLLIAVAALVVVLFVGACSSVYVKALWEAGDERCGKELAHYGGWEIGFSGDTDAFVCTVRDARLRIVAEKEIPVGKLIGRSGAWPYFSALVAHELEAIDKDSSPLGSRANFRRRWSAPFVGTPSSTTSRKVRRGRSGSNPSIAVRPVTPSEASPSPTAGSAIPALSSSCAR
jgi:hypothetical protein